MKYYFMMGAGKVDQVLTITKTLFITILVLSTGSSVSASDESKSQPLLKFDNHHNPISNSSNNNGNGTSYLEDSDSVTSTSENVDDDAMLSTTSRTAFRVTTSFSSSMKRSQLPLEKLFPHLIPSSSNTNATNSNPSILNGTTIRNDTSNNETESELSTKLSSRLLNHSILHGSDDELDRLVFSQLPEGSKLVLRTVKIVKTDENGNEETMGDPAVTWDVVPINSTVEEGSDDDYDDELGDDEEDADNDLDQAGSHPKTSEYQTYGSNEKRKTKKDKYFHGQDHAKDHTLTNTDTDGKKVTNYKGTEKGLNDFAKSHGNSQSNEGERYKNSKKKNKGRKVTGFKRVYHKEEFQRTEHFYDDEEAKKIAESYGLSDAVEKSKHGVKDDDRKYHGTHKEKTDEEKVKNEHSTKNGHHKGQQTVYKDSDDHKHNQHYRTSQQSHPPQQNHKNNYNHNNYYPQHSYQGAYSHQRPAPPVVGVRSRGEDFRPHSVRSVTTESPNPIQNPAEIDSEHPLTMPSGGDQSQYDPLRTMLPPAPSGPVFVPKPDEMKVFFVERERRKPDNYYAPNFGPEASESENVEGAVGYPDNGIISGFYNKIGDVNSSEVIPSSTGKPIRYSTTTTISQSLPPRLFDAIPEYYSTIQKMKTQPSGAITFVNYKPGSNLISIEKAKAIEPATETVPQYSRSEGLLFGNRYSNWVPMGSGSSNTENSVQPTTNITSFDSFESTEKEAPMVEEVPLDKNSTVIEVEVESETNRPPKPNNKIIGQYEYDLDDQKHREILAELAATGGRRPINGNGFPGRPRPVYPFRHSPGPLPAMRGKGHYYGRTIGPNSNRPHGPGGNFMDGLMNSVSEFFSRIGKK